MSPAADDIPDAPAKVFSVCLADSLFVDLDVSSKIKYFIIGVRSDFQTVLVCVNLIRSVLHLQNTKTPTENVAGKFCFGLGNENT